MIIRGENRPDGWVAIPNQTVRDTRLSLTAIGLLCHLLSHEAGWRVSADQVGRTFGIGRDRARKAMGELIDHGYASRTRTQDAAGRWNTETTVFDRPAVDNSGDNLGTNSVPTPEKPYVGISGVIRRPTKNEHGMGFSSGDTLNGTWFSRPISGDGLFS
jgi:hypothetical protein